MWDGPKPQTEPDNSLCPVLPESMVAMSGSMAGAAGFTLQGDDGDTKRTGKQLWTILRVHLKMMHNLTQHWGTVRKLYGQESDDVTELEKIEAWVKKAQCFCTPTQSSRKFWDLSQLFLLLYVAIMVPYRECFDDPVELNSAGFVVEVLIDSYFLLDICLNFITGYYDRAGTLVIDRKMIAKNYMKSWLVIDVLSILPFGYIELANKALNDENGKSGGNIKAFKLLRIFRIGKMLKLARLKRILERYQEHIQSMVYTFKLIFMLLISLFTTHVLACLWYAVGNKSQTMPSGDVIQGWVNGQTLLDDYNASISTKYITACYWAVTTLTTVGYGDISASTDLEKLTSLLCEFGGVIFFGAIVGTLSSLITREKASKMRYLEKMESTREFMQLKELDRSTQRKIRPPRSGPFKRPSIFHRKIACLVVLHGHDGGHLTKISGGFLAGQWRSTSTNFGRRLSSPSARS
jgi:hypothetical protein